jgi:hypothetical protein
VRSALKLLAETCWRHRSRWRGRLKHARAAELIGAVGESDSSVFCLAVMRLQMYAYASGHGRREGGMMRYGQAMSHDRKARAVATKMEVRSRVDVLRVRLRCPADGARGCMDVIAVEECRRWRWRLRLPAI